MESDTKYIVNTCTVSKLSMKYITFHQNNNFIYSKIIILAVSEVVQTLSWLFNLHDNPCSICMITLLSMNHRGRQMNYVLII